MDNPQLHSNFSLTEYQRLAERTAGAGKEGERRLIIAALGLGNIARQNVLKLQKRYPEGFDTQRSIHREDGNEPQSR